MNKKMRNSEEKKKSKNNTPGLLLRFNEPKLQKFWVHFYLQNTQKALVAGDTFISGLLPALPPDCR